MEGSVEKNVTINKTCRYAESNKALKYQKAHKCSGCKSKNTILIYEEDNSSVDSFGTGCKDSLSEYFCLDCHKYMTIEITGHYRKFYTR